MVLMHAKRNIQKRLSFELQFPIQGIYNKHDEG
jgi:hypothetical protein